YNNDFTIDALTCHQYFQLMSPTRNERDKNGDNLTKRNVTWIQYTFNLITTFVHRLFHWIFHKNHCWENDQTLLHKFTIGLESQRPEGQTTETAIELLKLLDKCNLSITKFKEDLEKDQEINYDELLKSVDENDKETLKNCIKKCLENGFENIQIFKDINVVPDTISLLVEKLILRNSQGKQKSNNLLKLKTRYSNLQLLRKIQRPVKVAAADQETARNFITPPTSPRRLPIPSYTPSATPLSPDTPSAIPRRLFAENLFSPQPPATPRRLFTTSPFSPAPFSPATQSKFKFRRDEIGNTPLHFYLLEKRADKPSVLRSLIKQSGAAGLEAVNAFNQTPLHCAVSSGNIKSVEELILKKADLTALDWNGNTPLHLAVLNGYTEIATLLIAQQQGLDIKNDEGKTVLHLAAQKGATEVIKTLIAAKALLNEKDDKNETPLHLLAAINEIAFFQAEDTPMDDLIEMLVECIEMLILSYKEPDAIHATNVKGQTPLHVAAGKGNIWIAKTLIECGASLNMQDKDGNTPCHLAAINKKMSLYILLLQLGQKNDEELLDVSLENSEQLTSSACLGRAEPDAEDWKNGNELLSLVGLEEFVLPTK
nr:Phosphocholine transferase AnkX [Chlamydiota bacterium]